MSRIVSFLPEKTSRRPDSTPERRASQDFSHCILAWGLGQELRVPNSVVLRTGRCEGPRVFRVGSDDFTLDATAVLLLAGYKVLMFRAKTARIQELAERYPQRIEELGRIFERRTNVYIDFANVKPWATKLGWHVDLKRLKQFLDSFDSINSIKLYQGTLTGDVESEQFVADVKSYGYDLTTKPVKI